MRLGRLIVSNFCNYESLSLDLSSLGVTLLSGDTGVGKSSCLDSISWCLFGSTSKDVAADDIRPWNGSTEPTKVTLEVDNFRITRIRGTAHENDLYIMDLRTGSITRGKSMTETQQLIVQHIGFTEELFYTACYFHQFSNHGNFFISKPKERREILENVVNQAVPNRLSDRIASERRNVNGNLEQLLKEQIELSSKLSVTKHNAGKLQDASVSWIVDHERAIADAQSWSDRFESVRQSEVKALLMQHQEISSKLVDHFTLSERLRNLKGQLDNYTILDQKLALLRNEKSNVAAEYKHLSKEIKRLEALPDTCPTCLSQCDRAHADRRKQDLSEQCRLKMNEATALDSRIELHTTALSARPKIEAEYQKLAKQENDNNQLRHDLQLLDAQIKVTKEKVNTHLIRLEELKAQTNPYRDQLVQLQAQIAELEAEAKEVKNSIAEQEYQLALLEHLSDIAVKLRGVIISREVQTLETETNKILETYYDAELRIRLILEGDDKLGIAVYRQGHECSFRQLSGGQRCILKLAFSFAFMQSALNKSGQTTNVLMLDEALNGLSEQLKVQTLQFLTGVSTRIPTILLIDHSTELERLCDNRIKVTGQPPVLEFV